jgi:hypothetical protein
VYRPYGQTTGPGYRIVGITPAGFRTPSSGSRPATRSRFVQTRRLVPVGGGTPLILEVVMITYNAKATSRPWSSTDRRSATKRL